MTSGAPPTQHRGPMGEPVGQPVGQPVIDRSVLGEWLAGDDTAIDELLAVFRDSARTEQTRMSEMLAVGDLREFASAAHRLRGAALSMGARALAETAGTLYVAARAGDGEACAGGMAELAARIRLMAAEIPASVITSRDTRPAGAT
jgi:HPt (histidine-containing phosphotransfer) domain-containing protein